MRLKVFLPQKIMMDESVIKVIAEAVNGSFCLMPRHINFATLLVPGILTFFSASQSEEFLAVDEGILVKCDAEVLVSTRQAIRSQDLGQLQQTVIRQFRRLDEREQMTRFALAKLEADIVRQFVELDKHG